jgi:UDP:flavonoid glycosyltransferase YjiC (YdhE family)
MKILAYTSPAVGHLLPMSALLAELSRRGHTVHVRTLSSGVDVGRRIGFTADTVDPRIEATEMDDWKGTNARGALNLGVKVFGRRAEYEVGDLADAITRIQPDAMLVDVNCWVRCRLLGVLYAIHPAATSAWGATVWTGPETTAWLLGPGSRCRRARNGDPRA